MNQNFLNEEPTQEKPSNINNLNIPCLYQNVQIHQQFNYIEGQTSIYNEAIKILNENIEMKNVSFINLVNKLKDKIAETEKELSDNLKQPIKSNRNIINLKGMKIKENKKRILVDETNFVSNPEFEEEKSNNERTIFSHTFKKIKDV